MQSEPEQTKQRTFIVKLLSWTGQLALFVVIFFAASWYQQKDMLEIDQKLKHKQLKLISIQGQLENYQLDNGKRDTFIYFFAPWCSICHASIDNLESIYQENPDNINIILVALDWGSIDEVDSFLSQHSLTMPVLLGTNEVRDNFKIFAFPSYYLISRFGEVKAKNVGYTTELGMKLRMNFKL